MALWRTLAWFSICILLAFVVVLSPFSLSSKTCFQGGRKVAEDTALLQETQTNPMKGVEDKASGFAAEDSAREVPTGPDPLHHHHNPLTP